MTTITLQMSGEGYAPESSWVKPKFRFFGTDFTSAESHPVGCGYVFAGWLGQGREGRGRCARLTRDTQAEESLGKDEVVIRLPDVNDMLNDERRLRKYIEFFEKEVVAEHETLNDLDVQINVARAVCKDDTFVLDAGNPLLS